MKKFVALLLCIAIFTAFSGCIPIVPSGENGDNASTPDGTTAAVDTTAAETTTAAADNSVQDGSGTLGDYVVTIKSFFLSKNYDDAPAVVIEYEWTNNNDKAESFTLALDDTVYQDGIECESAIFVEDPKYDSDAQGKDIKPGSKQTVQVAYILNDTTTPIEVEVQELFTFADKPPMVTKTFEIK